MPTMYAKRVIAAVRQDPMTTIPRTCFKHEIPLLVVINGEANVSIVDDHSMPNMDKLVELDSANERGRLDMIYGQHPKTGEGIVDMVYGIPVKCSLHEAGEKKPSRKSPSKPKAEATVEVEAG